MYLRTTPLTSAGGDAAREHDGGWMIPRSNVLRSNLVLAYRDSRYAMDVSLSLVARTSRLPRFIHAQQWGTGRSVTMLGAFPPDAA